jgi:hypothetical protein
MAHKIVEPAPLALATMKRFGNDHVLPKGPAELAARFGADLAAVRDSAPPRASAHSGSGANRAMRVAEAQPAERPAS